VLAFGSSVTGCLGCRADDGPDSKERRKRQADFSSSSSEDDDLPEDEDDGSDDEDARGSTKAGDSSATRGLGAATKAMKEDDVLDGLGDGELSRAKRRALRRQRRAEREAWSSASDRAATQSFVPAVVDAFPNLRIHVVMVLFTRPSSTLRDSEISERRALKKSGTRQHCQSTIYGQKILDSLTLLESEKVRR